VTFQSNKNSVTFFSNHDRLNIPEMTITADELEVQPAVNPHTLADKRNQARTPGPLQPPTDRPKQTMKKRKMFQAVSTKNQLYAGLIQARAPAPLQPPTHRPKQTMKKRKMFQAVSTKNQ
jgi:hypothetical protein